jgi:hypothetical protein
MDACARICQHYLSRDDVRDIEFRDGALVCPDPPESDGTVLKERRILIYAEFPSMTSLLTNVSRDILQVQGLYSHWHEKGT